MYRFIASSLIYNDISFGKRKTKRNGAFGSQTRKVCPITMATPTQDLTQE